MQRKNLFRLGLTGIVLVTSLLILGSGKPEKIPVPVKEKKTTCCKKAAPQTCPVETRDTAPGELILGNLSNQFISITSFN